MNQEIKSMNKVKFAFVALAALITSNAFAVAPCTQAQADRCKCGSGYTCYAWGNEVGCNSSSTTDGIASGTYNDCKVGFKPLPSYIYKK